MLYQFPYQALKQCTLSNSRNLFFYPNFNNSAASWQNQQNGMCSQRSLRSAWASALSGQCSLSAWRKVGSFATQWVHSEDSNQTGWMPRLIWVFAGRTCHFVGFVMRWFNFIPNIALYSYIVKKHFFIDAFLFKVISHVLKDILIWNYARGLWLTTLGRSSSVLLVWVHNVILTSFFQ